MHSFGTIKHCGRSKGFEFVSAQNTILPSTRNEDKTKMFKIGDYEFFSKLGSKIIFFINQFGMTFMSFA